MTDQKLIHIANKLYKTEKLEKCPNCRKQITASVRVTLFDEKAEVTESCNFCEHDVIISCYRVKPSWVQLKINEKEMKAESIQTCSERWVVSNF